MATMLSYFTIWLEFMHFTYLIIKMNQYQKQFKLYLNIVTEGGVNKFLFDNGVFFALLCLQQLILLLKWVFLKKMHNLLKNNLNSQSKKNRRESKNSLWINTISRSFVEFLHMLTIESSSLSWESFALWEMVSFFHYSAFI